MEQSIARFEKRLEDANDALSTLGKHLGRGATSSYKEVTAALRALRREAAKTNKQALEDFDKVRGAITKSSASSSRSSRSGAGSTSARSTGSRSSGSGSTSSRSTSSRSTAPRSTASRSRAKKS
ncbi:MAG: hypothetical protein ACLP4R_31150 [Solirubrobacteraceae bacterium]